MQQPVLEPAIYGQRFSPEEIVSNRLLWAPICAYLQRYIDPNGATLDLGAGYCHFINNIQSRKKFAVDVNAENLDRYAASDVVALACSGARIEAVASESLNAVFASNVYEHFTSREEVAASFREVWRLLKPGGSFLILQPNFAYCSRQYYDFFDHRLAFTHLGMKEGLEISGFAVDVAIPRFLPYTTKSRLPQAPWLVAMYLRFPPAWRVLGHQMLLVARKPR